MAGKRIRTKKPLSFEQAKRAARKSVKDCEESKKAAYEGLEKIRKALAGEDEDEDEEE